MADGLREVPQDWYWKRGGLEKIRSETRKLAERHKGNAAARQKLLAVIEKLSLMIERPGEALRRGSGEQAREVNRLTAEIKKMGIEELVGENTPAEERGIEAATNIPGKPGFLKKAAAIVITALTALGAYTGSKAYAGDTQILHGRNDKGKIETIIDYGNGIGRRPDGSTVILPDKSIGLYPGGGSGRYFGREEEKETPGFNYDTPQKYIEEANKAYKKKDYQKIIDLSEEAMQEIKKGN